MSLHHGTEEGQWYTEKICPRHWERLAVVYVRQSTMQQVLEPQESTRLPYGLVRRAIAWGWPEARVAAPPRTRYAPGHAHPQTHGGPMQHPHEVDMVLAVLDTREIIVYGRDLRRPLGADGEDVQTSVARIPIGRPESADVLKAYFAACGSVTWAKVLDVGRQIPRL